MPLYPKVMVPLQIDLAIGVGRYLLAPAANPGVGFRQYRARRATVTRRPVPNGVGRAFGASPAPQPGLRSGAMWNIAMTGCTQTSVSCPPEQDRRFSTPPSWTSCASFEDWWA